jgi:hypothetical protein
MSPATEEARIRARHALARLEDAQRCVREAAAQLAPVRGADREHVRLQRLDAKLRRAWNRLARLFDGRLDLDAARMPAELGSSASVARRAA